MALRFSRRALVAALFATGTALAVGCGLGSDVGEDDLVGATTDPITDITQTWVRRQTVGNCWLYAAASWAESHPSPPSRGTLMRSLRAWMAMLAASV